MDNAPSSENKESPNEPPAPEVLKTRTEDGYSPSDGGSKADNGDGAAKPPAGAAPPKPAKPRRRAYRPSHKATFIGVSVVMVILALNAGVITFIIKKQSGNEGINRDQVTISQDTLSKLGVNRSAVGDSGVKLIVGPDARFNGTVQIAGDTSISGQLKLNNKLTAPSASIANLQAGKTALSELSVNGDTTLSKLTLRNDLGVAGSTHLQGAVTVDNLLTVNNSLNVAGNLSVGGTLAVSKLSIRTLIISGHIITLGSTPSVSRGSCLGSNGTVSISGNDTSGTVVANAGAGACSGILVNVGFRSGYSGSPHVVITPVNRGLSNFYITRNAGGFSIGGSPSPGGYAFDYIVEQ
jgi:cytoskeletal protein CcmA (bactofilin family)